MCAATPTPHRDRSTGSGDTKARLIRAALDTVGEDGLAAASARTIAARARAAQGLIFYHFGTVNELLEAASNHAVDDSAHHFRAAFAKVTSLNGLLSVGRTLHDRERVSGNVAFMAQLMSGAQHDPVLARAAEYAMSAWTGEVHAVLVRILEDGPMTDLVDLDGLAALISAGFIGLELYDGVDHQGATRALTTLEALGRLTDALNNLGPVARRALHATTDAARDRDGAP